MLWDMVEQYNVLIVRNPTRNKGNNGTKDNWKNKNKHFPHLIESRSLLYVKQKKLKVILTWTYHIQTAINQRKEKNSQKKLENKIHIKLSGIIVQRISDFAITISNWKTNGVFEY
jgi:hypothetical protein